MTKTYEFIEKIKDSAIKEMRKHKINASLIIAQAILESGWGTCELSKNANNLFGIKRGSWRGPVYKVTTKEYYNGECVTIQDSFRKYVSWSESIQDHSAVLLQDIYKSVIGCTDYKQACVNVYKSGYATDPNYYKQLIELIEQYKLYNYDEKINKDIPEDFTKCDAACVVIVDVLNVRSGPSTNSEVVAQYEIFEKIQADRIYTTNGYEWISYISNSGIRRFVASKRLSDNKKYINFE